MVKTAIAAAMVLAAVPTKAELPAWLAGCWVEEKGNRWTEECWTAPRAGLMQGSGRSGRGDQLGSWEAMQIVADDATTDAKTTFWGAPRGQGRTAFTLVPDPAPGVTFVNAAHDFPLRIRYWREGDVLNAEVSRADGSGAMRWRYRQR